MGKGSGGAAAPTAPSETLPAVLEGAEVSIGRAEVLQIQAFDHGHLTEVIIRARDAERDLALACLAIALVHEGSTWKPDHDSFEAYVEALGIGRSTAYRWINAGKVIIDQVGREPAAAELDRARSSVAGNLGGRKAASRAGQDTGAAPGQPAPSRAGHGEGSSNGTGKAKATGKKAAAPPAPAPAPVIDADSRPGRADPTADLRSALAVVAETTDAYADVKTADLVRAHRQLEAVVSSRTDGPAATSPAGVLDADSSRLIGGVAAWANKQGMGYADAVDRVLERLTQVSGTRSAAAKKAAATRAATKPADAASPSAPAGSPCAIGKHPPSRIIGGVCMACSQSVK